MSDDVTLSQPEGRATGKKLLWFQQEPQIGGGGFKVLERTASE